MKLQNIVCCLSLTVAANASTQVLSNFNSPSELNAYGSWAFTSDGTGLSVVSPSTNSGGFFVINSVPDWSPYSFVEIRARVDANNQASRFFFYFDSDFGATAQVFEVPISSFGSSYTTVLVPISFTSISPSAIESWGISTEPTDTTPVTPMRITFDRVALTAVPEPSAFAALAGFAAVGFAATRRRRRV